MALPSNPNSGAGLPSRPPQRPNSEQNVGLPPLGKREPEMPVELPAIDRSLTSNERLSHYDFDAKKVERPGLASPAEPEEDEADDPFEVIPPADAVMYDEEDETPALKRAPTPTSESNGELIEELAKSSRQKHTAEAFNKRNSGKAKKSKEYKPQSGELDSKGQNVFIDDKSKKLTPFGGKKSLKVADFDARKNRRQQARMVQTVVIVLLSLIVLFGAFNAIVPKKTLSERDVMKTVQQTVAMTDFPIEAGKGFANDFMKAYFSLGSDPAAQSVLNYYYSGRLVAGAQNYPNRVNTKGYAQKTLYGPTIYGAKYLTDTSANFTVGALVQPEDSSGVDAEGNPIVSSPSDGSTAQWVFFSVNVYYNPETLQFAVTPDSPTLIPKPQNMASTSVPEPAKLGLGDEIEDPKAVKATVQGFMEGYRTSTPEDHIRLDQYLTAKPSVDLYNGLGGIYEFAGSKGIDSALTYAAYATDSEEIKVLVKVAWEYKFTDEVSTVYNSQYIMTLEPTSTSYVVTKFAPYYFTAKESS